MIEYNNLTKMNSKPMTSEEMNHIAMVTPPELPLPKFKIIKMDSQYEDRFTPNR